MATAFTFRVAQLLVFDTPAHRLHHIVTTADSQTVAGVSADSSDSALLPPSPLNPDLVLPEDIYAAVCWTFAWALLHAVLFRTIIKPLSERCIRIPSKASASKSGETADARKPEQLGNLRKRGNSNRKSRQKYDSTIDHLSSEESKEVLAALAERTKLQVSMWKFIVYMVTVCVGIATLSREDWWMDPKLYFKGYPHYTNTLMKIYYNVGFGNYAYQLYTIFAEPKQTDFVQMLSHHICTLAVMAVSYFTSFTRIGSVILLLHDMADPIMEFAKCWLYCGNQMMADIFFAIFALTFLVTRNLIFPFYVIGSCIPYGVYEDGARMPRGYTEYFWICLGCLWVLQFLNLNWGFLICKMVVRAVRSGGKVEGDIRDQDDATVVGGSVRKEKDEGESEM